MNLYTGEWRIHHNKELKAQLLKLREKYHVKPVILRRKKILIVVLIEEDPHLRKDR